MHTIPTPKRYVLATIGVTFITWLFIGHAVWTPQFCGNDTARPLGVFGCTSAQLDSGYDAVGIECAFDPACASPFYNINRHPNPSGHVPEWTGAQVVPDYIGPRNVVRLFSLLSLILLDSVTLLPAVGIAWLYPRSKVGRIVIIGCLMWYALKLLGWPLVFWGLASQYGDSFVYSDWATWLVIGISVLPFVGCLLFVRTRLRKFPAV